MIHRGFIHETFNKTEQNKIHNFLSNIGRMRGSRSDGSGRSSRRSSRKRRYNNQSDEDSGNESESMKHLSKGDKKIVHKYFEMIGHKGPEVHKGFLKDNFTKYEQGVIHDYLSGLRQGRKFKGKDYNSKDLERERSESSTPQKRPRRSREDEYEFEQESRRVGKSKQTPITKIARTKVEGTNRKRRRSSEGVRKQIEYEREDDEEREEVPQKKARPIKQAKRQPSSSSSSKQPTKTQEKFQRKIQIQKQQKTQIQSKKTPKSTTKPATSSEMEKKQQMSQPVYPLYSQIFPYLSQGDQTFKTIRYQRKIFLF
jgi:hypothetical protein